MAEVVVYLAIFIGLGAFFLFIHLLMGKLIRPLQVARQKRLQSEQEKLTIYECGEPTIGSAWIQFDLRYYVVALLFVIFDVEVAFFFPWAVVFGKANTLALESTPVEQRIKLTEKLGVTALPKTSDAEGKAFAEWNDKGLQTGTAKSMAWIGFADIMVFFGVLLVGFAYLWKRGDINWVRSVISEEAPAMVLPTEAPPAAPADELVGSGQK